MNENATNSPKRKMDCGTVARDEILESYLLSRLSEEDRNAFEQHYFDCARCFDELQTLQAIRDELPRARVEWETKSVHPFIRWAPAAGLAAAVLAVTVVLWMRPSSPSPEATKTPSQAQIPEGPKPQEPEPQPEPTVGPQLSLEQLARVEPPRYEAPILRSTPDEATARFQRGMGHYRKADYAAAVGDLRTAAELDPDAAHIRFFLGISHLMLGQDDVAIDRLRATIVLGDSPYLEEAHLYLAKAFLRRSDLGAAETQLMRLIQLRGPRSEEAQRLLTQVEGLKPRKVERPKQ
jgi:tetratricopeptide (TPR) repeat protein